MCLVPLLIWGFIVYWDTAPSPCAWCTSWKGKEKLSAVPLCWLQFVCLLGALPAALPDQDHPELGLQLEPLGQFHGMVLALLGALNCHWTKCWPALSSSVLLQGLSSPSVLKTLKHKEFCWTGSLISAHLGFPGECVGFLPHFLSHLLS